tara:strand:- start:9001 stop:9684 length:684 start_codon:yes stop_codon:yes gene_type:complete
MFILRIHESSRLNRLTSYGSSLLFISIVFFSFNGCATRSVDPRTSSFQKRELLGKASWYGQPYHGRKTANGETYDMYALTAAHRTLPFNSRVLVERTDTQDKVEVRINDRGPFVETRVIDLSKGAASKIRMIRKGVVPVIITPYEIPTERKTKWIVLIGGFKSSSELNYIRRKLQRDGNYVLKIKGWHGDRSKHHLQVRKINNKDRAKRLAKRLRNRGYAAFLVRSK